MKRFSDLAHIIPNTFLFVNNFFKYFLFYLLV
nr:MAG TPA: hypothetical protein [Caudoviricetes sp.]